MEQTSLPPETEVKTPATCAWCGKPSIGQIELEPARYSFGKPDENGKKLRFLRKRAIVAQVCSYHHKHLVLTDDAKTGTQ